MSKEQTAEASGALFPVEIMLTSHLDLREPKSWVAYLLVLWCPQQVSGVGGGASGWMTCLGTERWDDKARQRDNWDDDWRQRERPREIWERSG